MKTKSEITRIARDSEQFRIEARNLAFNYCPPIYDCKKCSHPVISGYCCTTCGTGSPQTTVEEDAAFERKYG